MDFVSPPPYVYIEQWTIPEKNETGGIEDMEFLGVSKK